MRDVVEQSGGDVLLANVYGDHVMNVIVNMAPHQPRSAMIAVAHCPCSAVRPRKPSSPSCQSPLKRIYEQQAIECRRAGLGSTWKEFRSALAAIRRDGCVIGQGELDPHVIGIAAPIFAEDERILGSLTLIVSKLRYKLMDQTRLVELVLEASRRTTLALGRLSKSNDR